MIVKWITLRAYRSTVSWVPVGNGSSCISWLFLSWDHAVTQSSDVFEYDCVLSRRRCTLDRHVTGTRLTPVSTLIHTAFCAVTPRYGLKCHQRLTTDDRARWRVRHDWMTSKFTCDKLKKLSYRWQSRIRKRRAVSVRQHCLKLSSIFPKSICPPTKCVSKFKTMVTWLEPRPFDG